jgi:ribonuclease P protein component
VAYAVPRSVGNAVERNRVRRRLRAAVAGHVAELCPGGAYLLGADRRVLHAPFATIDRAVCELLRAAGGVTG